MNVISTGMRTLTLGSLAIAAALVATPVSAATITFDLTGANDGGTVGNTRTYTSGGVTVTATAWSYLSSFQQAALGRWTAGVGVCGQSEIASSGCASPEHQVDNDIYQDYVLFQFSAAVDPLSVVINSTSGADLDASYWVGTLTLPADKIKDDSIAALAGQGFGARIDNDYTGSASSRTVTLTSNLATGLLFGARAGQSNDAFKISSLMIDRPDNLTVPEPLSVLMLGLGLLGVAPRLRRRV